ncbi:DUF4888 domain-containing protein [Staphylococcus aureus]
MNTKFLGKTLVAKCSLVLTTLGTGLHSSYLGLDTNKVVKTAKAEEKMTDGQLWKKVKDSLHDSDIILSNEYETIKRHDLLSNGYSSSVSAPGNDDGGHLTQSIDFKGLKQIDLTKENVYDDFNKKLDAKIYMEFSNREVKGLGLLQMAKVSIDLQIALLQVSGKVGEGVTSGGENTLTKRFINKITID